MMKEIDYSPSEGILPDAGDINYDIVQKIMNMKDESDSDSNESSDKWLFNNLCLLIFLNYKIKRNISFANI